MNFSPIAWLWLVLAIMGEMVGTLSLKASKELSLLLPTSLILIGYGLSFYFLILTMRHLPVAISYSLWSAFGIVFITIFSAYKFGEKPDLPAILGLGFIITGVVLLTIVSKFSAHHS